jgi:hypothetical protein
MSRDIAAIPALRGANMTRHTGADRDALPDADSPVPAGPASGTGGVAAMVIAPRGDAIVPDRSGTWIGQDERPGSLTR